MANKAIILSDELKASADWSLGFGSQGTFSVSYTKNIVVDAPGEAQDKTIPAGESQNFTPTQEEFDAFADHVAPFISKLIQANEEKLGEKKEAENSGDDVNAGNGVSAEEDVDDDVNAGAD